ncbi:MAG: energy-coupling factor transporter transmembrane component T [Emergencia sp.]
MDHNGLGEKAEFCSFHPFVNAVYFIFVIGITMFSLSPYFLAVTFAGAWVYSALLKGRNCLKLNLSMSIVMLLLMVIINMFFNNNGETVLLYINTSRITLESICYGIAGGLMLVSVIIWFSCFNVIMTADKLIYLFGKVAPVLGLTLSMIFRFIPLLKSRFAEISLGQKCMGRSHSSGSIVRRARQLTKEVSILIAWSLEASIESADSMEARGYGLKGRTSFHLFRFSHRDYGALAVMTVTGVAVAAAACFGLTDMYFYPRTVMPELDLPTLLALICYIILVLTPVIIDIAGEIKWKQSDLNT